MSCFSMKLIGHEAAFQEELLICGKEASSVDKKVLNGWLIGVRNLDGNVMAIEVFLRKIQFALERQINTDKRIFDLTDFG